MDPFESDLRDFLSKNFLYGREDVDISGGDSLMEKGVLDSTGVLELIGWLQKTQSIEIEDEELVPDNLDTIDNLVRFVRRKKSAASA